MSDFIGILSHSEAAETEIQQLASSGCGVTALCNVLVSLNVVSREQAKELDLSGCILRTRLNDEPLPEYLLSRSVAGCTGEDLVTSMSTLLANNQHVVDPDIAIVGNFVSYMDIVSSGNTLNSFLTRNISEGNALVALLNLQLLGNDAWHHQMIYGMESTLENVHNMTRSLVHCVNPICAYPMHFFEKMLSTESVLLVRAQDILERYARPNGDISIYEQPEWKEMGVGKQIDSLIRKSTADSNSSSTEFVVIPANYVGGLAVFTRVIK